jgi:uncharacterized protein (TIGR02118 family)
MIKLTVLYGHPVDPTAFEAYYFNTHMPLVGKINGTVKAETTKFLPGLDGIKPSNYRMAELYFKNTEELQTALSSPEGTATTGDLGNFASGGVTILVGEID